MDFEKSLNRLNEIEEEMNQDNLNLDKNIELFKEAQKHLKFCNEKIEKAQLEFEKISN